MLLEFLVDGELDETQRTEVIRSLDSVPDGWKTCALLFLEDQCLRSALTDGFFPGDELSPPPEHRLNAPRQVDTFDSPPRKEHVPVKGLTLLAAGLIFGLALGGLFSHSLLNALFPDERLLVQDPESGFQSDKPVSPNNPVPPQHPYTTVSANDLYASYCQSMKTCPFPPETHSHPNLTLAVSPQTTDLTSPSQSRLVSVKTGRRVTENLLVPCFDNRTLDPRQIRTKSDLACEETLKRLRCDGCQVDVRRQYYILKGDENELILIPAEDTIIHYENNPGLQEL